MSIAVNIISAVLKSVVGDKLGSGLTKDLIGFSIDGISEKSINEITDFINKRRAKIDNILSKESMKSMGISENHIDYVVTEIKDLFSKIEITDEILRQCRYESMNLSDFLWNKYCECKNDNIEYECEIKRCLFALAEALNKVMRESEDFSDKMLIQISNAVDDTNVGLQNISDYLNNNFGKLNADNQAILEILQMILEQNQEDGAKNKAKRQSLKSRTQEYADKWEANMFLNDFDEWDENAGVNVKLSDVYINEHLPHFMWGNNKNESDKLDVLLSQYITKSNDNKMLLILGQPGIGKSTLITWITANFSERIDDILVYRFASDLKNINWQKGRISNRIIEELGLNHNDLNGKILILDGFDEVSIEVNRRRDILDSLYIDLINNKSQKNFSLIVTCRENYVPQFAILKCKYITLQPWNERQITSFCNIFQEKTKYDISEKTIKKLIENKQILGIPLILYMALALNISIEKEGSIVDVYDKIFSLEGGIYDRCIDNRMFADKHRIGEIKKQIHQISREIAIWMFEDEADKASITQQEYQIICNNITQEQQTNEEMERDFLIGNFFKLVKHYEGVESEEICFVHRSIYEYFVAETIYSSIENAMIELSEESQVELAGNIAFYLKKGKISPTIGEYLQHKFIKLYNRLNAKKKRDFYQWWENTVNKMMETGMFYYTERNIQNYKNIISKEVRVLMNLMQILRLLNITNKKKYIMEKSHRELLERYIRYCVIELSINPRKEILNLNNMCLSNLNLKYISLAGTEMTKVNLSKTDLSKVDLSKANLAESDFGGAYLIGTDLRGANLSIADLCETDLTSVKLAGANMSKTKLNASIWTKDNIKKTIKQLREASFDYLLVRESSGLNIVYRNELFCGNLFS